MALKIVSKNRQFFSNQILKNFSDYEMIFVSKVRYISNTRQKFLWTQIYSSYGKSKIQTIVKTNLPKNMILRQLSSDYNRIRQLSAKSRNKNIVLYATAFVLLVLGGTYASVPLYRIYCQSTGKGGKPFIDKKANEKIMNMKRAEDRELTVTFSAETTSQMAWNFKPTQPILKCVPGETVLAFFTAKNPLDNPVNGIATYTVQPFEAGTYLNKIQCFCFEEQRLNPHEEVDLPVFFYIDPEYANDPKLENVDNIVLSYTFFEAKKGMKLPTIMNSSSRTPPPMAEPSLALQKL